MNEGRILIVEDEPLIAQSVEAYLRNQEYDTLVAYDGNSAWRQFQSNNCDLVVLDLMLPGISGEELCKMIRKVSTVPILMLTAKALEDDLINGLQLGADDYLIKPFSPRELVARVNSLIRRSQAKFSNLKQSWMNGWLQLDNQARLVYRQGKEVNLTNHEYKILMILLKAPNQVFTRLQLIDLAFDEEFLGFERTIDTHIKNIRLKIEPDHTPQLIVTVHGVGYKCNVLPDQIYQEWKDEN
jgi:DNA-binding response OmpR family regulator